MISSSSQFMRFVFFNILLLSAGPLLSQSFPGPSVHHNLGKFVWRVDPGLWLDTSGPMKPTGSWPQGVYDSENIPFHYFSIVTESYVDSSSNIVQKEMNNYFSLPAPEEYEAPWGLIEYRRDQPSDILINGELENEIFAGAIDLAQNADIMSVLKLKAKPGFWITLKTYSFTNQNHDDYVINHMNIQYTRNWEYEDDNPDIPPQILDNVYFSLWYMLQPSRAGTKEILGHRWGEDAYDDWVDWESRAPTIPSDLDAVRPEMILGYGWDGDEDDVVQLEAGGQYFNDTGDPSFTHEQKGQFLSYQYPGYTLLHADTAPSDGTDDASQPHSILVSSQYEFWNQNFGGMNAYDFISSGEMQHPPDWQAAGNSHWKRGDDLVNGIGPYSFSEGEDIDIVWAVGVGGIPWDSTVTKGAEWLSWYRGEPGATFDNEAKRDYIRQGLDSLHENLSHARWAWDRISTGEPIPTPPRAPDLAVTTGEEYVHLSWEDLSGIPDAVTGVPDLAGYRIFRKSLSSLINYEEAEFGLGLNYEMIADVGPDETEYFDYGALPHSGEELNDWFYYVVAYDDGSQNTTGLYPGQSLESSHYANRHTTGVRSIPVNSLTFVPDDYESVQTAVDMSLPGDTIIMRPGIYEEFIVLNHNLNQQITLGSMFLLTGDTAYISSTVLQGGGIDLHNESDLDPMILSGLTIRNTSNGITGEGALVLDNLLVINSLSSGINFRYSDFSLNNVTLENNAGNPDGGGLFLLTSSGTMQNSKIHANTARKGGGIFIRRSQLKLVNTLVHDNYSELSGGGMYASLSGNDCELEMINSTISSNTAGTTGGGLIADGGPRIRIMNSIVWENQPDQIFFANYASYPDTAQFEYSNIQRGLEGMVATEGLTINWLEGSIDLDPLFMDTSMVDFSLSGLSPCIDAGMPDVADLGLPSIDLAGNVRVWDGNSDGSARIDMGAHEYGAPVSIHNGDETTPLKFQLRNNYPNPFNSTTTIRYELPVSGEFKLVVYDLRGRKVQTLAADYASVGRYETRWYGVDDANNPVSAGIYFCRLEASSFSKTIKMVLLK